MVFNAAVDLTIFGKRLYLALGFSLTNPLASLRGGASKATNWYKDKMNPKGRTDTEKQYYDKPNPFADFEMSGKSVGPSMYAWHFSKVSSTPNEIQTELSSKR